MRDVTSAIDLWLAEESPVALATVINTWGSAPRKVGAKMAVTATGLIAGSVSGGCVEGAVIEASLDTLVNRHSQLLHFGVTDETAWDIGLACGGSIDVFVEPLDSITYKFQHDLLDKDEHFATVTIIKGPANLLSQKLIVQRGGRLFGEISTKIDGIAAARARAALSSGSSERIVIDLPDSGMEPLEVFIEISHPAPTLVVIGGVHIAIALTSIAKTLGYKTVVIDPRLSFGSEERFPHVDRLIQAWPGEAIEQIQITSSTAVASLTHDPKIDDPALKLTLASPAFYVGALGSRKTHQERRRRLLAANVPEERLSRIHAPIGLNIGAQTPEEIAIAIMAEIVAASHDSKAGIA